MKALLRLIILLASFSLLFLACSDDDNSTNSNVDPDELAAAMEPLADNMVLAMNGMFDDGVEYFGGMGSLTKPADTSYTNFDSTTYWWINYVDMTYVYGDYYTMYMTGIDSIRFLAGSDYQEEPNEQTDFLQCRLYVNTEYEYAADSSLTFDISQSGDYEKVSDDTLIVDGAWDYDIDYAMPGDNFEYLFAGDYTDIGIAYYESDGSYLPYDGTMTMTIDITYAGDEFDADLTIEFTEGGYDATMTIEGETYTWSVTYNTVTKTLPLFPIMN